MSEIQSVIAREILDSRGNPTVEVEVHTASGVGRAAVPSGASTGEHEAVELRDGDKKRYVGKGVLKAVKNVETVARARDHRHGRARPGRRSTACCSRPTARRTRRSSARTRSSASRWRRRAPPPTPSICRSGATSAAPRRASCPTPMMNILNGGMHADNGLEIQEFMIVPYAAPTLRRRAPRGRRDLPRAEGDPEEGRARRPRSATRAASRRAWPRTRRPCSASSRAIEAAGYKPGEDVGLALDAALSEFYDKKTRAIHLRQEADARARRWSRSTRSSCAKYPIVSIEDGCSEHDDKGWKLLTDKLGKKVQLVGDDLFVTNPERLAKPASRTASPTRSSSS